MRGEAVVLGFEGFCDGLDGGGGGRRPAGRERKTGRKGGEEGGADGMAVSKLRVRGEKVRKSIDEVRVCHPLST